MSSELRSLLRYLLPTLAVVALLLIAVQLWLRGGGVGGEQGRAEPADDPRPGDFSGNTDPTEQAGPDAIGFQPEPGSYLLEVRTEGAAAQRIGLDIRARDGGGYRISRPYFPPITLLDPVPELLAPHVGRIRMQVEVSPEGDILDVTGPDRYFDQLDARSEGSADPIRELQLEEQVAAALAWPMETILAGAAVGERVWTESFTLPGYGQGQARRLELNFKSNKPERCGPRDMEELCLPVMVTTLTSSDGSSIDGTLWLGAETGMGWVSELVARKASQRRVVRAVLRRR